MNQLKAQNGASFYMITLGIIIAVFIGLIVMKSIPIYLNQMKVERAISNAAQDPELSKATILQIRKKMQKQWDIEDIANLDTKDVKLIRTKEGVRKLKYDYEWREPLFLNVSMVHEFGDEVSMSGVSAE